MSLVILLEDFGKPPPPAQPVTQSAGALDDSARLAIFEDGFKAGWDDATAAQSEDMHRISSQFAQNLQDLSFTYHEAVSHVTKSIKPVLGQIVSVLLPQLADRAIGSQIVEQLELLVQRSVHTEVKILTSSQDFDAITGLLSRDFGFPIRCEVSPEFMTGQAELVFADSEISVDCQEALTEIAALFDGFVYENERSLAHG